MNVATLVAYNIHKAIPNSQFVVFEQSGHSPFYEEQQGFVLLLDGFLSGKQVIPEARDGMLPTRTSAPLAGNCKALCAAASHPQLIDW